MTDPTWTRPADIPAGATKDLTTTWAAAGPKLLTIEGELTDNDRRNIASVIRERNELRAALAAALKDDAIEEGYAAGRDDSLTLVRGHIDLAEAEDCSESILAALENVAKDLEDPIANAPRALGRWLDLVWKQAIEDRDDAWAALDSLGIAPRHAAKGADRLRAALADVTRERDQARAEAATMREVARSNKRHVRYLAEELEAAHAAAAEVSDAHHEGFGAGVGWADAHAAAEQAIATSAARDRVIERRRRGRGRQTLVE